jgi:hypothetical protein
VIRPPDGQNRHGPADPAPELVHSALEMGDPPAGRAGVQAIEWVITPDEPDSRRGDPGTVILTCANCGAEMIGRKCKLICRCGYFLSCSDYY